MTHFITSFAGKRSNTPNMKNKRCFFLESSNKLKSSGVGISHSNIFKLGRRNSEENGLMMAEADREQKFLRVKKHFMKKGWNFPPKSHPYVSIVHLINSYYGKEVCIHTPQDDLEKLTFKK